ncbi:histidine kinase [Paenibacillus albidus]|uniref:sensor histidine kinase n=1 Tax=Paenibacillus albidus TaxID=2041023 RepID=UPI001BE4F1BD|nr:histidine kinase [Paenibacillus albidus]MBT2293145.1 histidine kinase [Paenibacillus albidus]
MMRFPNKGFTNSIFVKLLALFTILIPVVGMFIYSNYQTRSTLLNQVQITHENMLESYWFQIDNQLNIAVTFTVNTAWFKADPQMALSNDDSVSALAKQRISLDLAEQITIGVNVIDTLFVYTDNDYISAGQINQVPEERSAIKSYVLEMAPKLETSSMQSNWKMIKINNQTSMIHFNKGDNGVVTGVYVNLDRLVSHYSPTDETSSLFLLSNEDAATFRSKQPKNSLLITAPSSVAPIAFVEAIPSNTILRSLPFMQRYMVAVSVIVALLLPFAFYTLRLIVVQPLQKLTRAMKHIRHGDLQYRIAPYRASNEITIVNHTFNQMMDEVQQLKINVYEEEIKAQKSQLRNLQLQIQPHFIINSLNMVYNLLANGDSRTAKQLIVHSVDFYRYMVKVDTDFVPLYEETKHVNTYLQIQSIRYKNKFTYSIETNQLIADMLVPPMLIHNFVENSIKYAIQTDKAIHISVQVDSFEIEFYPYAKIVIADTGSGYPVHQLELLNQGKVIVDQNGEHIGIRNSVKRLALLFKGRAKWRFYNRNGATSELTLPAVFPVHAASIQEDEE